MARRFNRRKQKHQRHHRSPNLIAIIYPKSWVEVLRLYENRCAYCQTLGNAENRITRDHIIPKAFGGPNAVDNYIPACVRCNSLKADAHPLQWLKEWALRGVFVGPLAEKRIYRAIRLFSDSELPE